MNPRFPDPWAASSRVDERAAPATRVAIVGYDSRRDFHGYDLYAFSPEEYFGKMPSLARVLRGGFKEAKKAGMLYSASGLDRLYRSADADYMRMVSAFVDRYRNFDLIVMSRFNPIHPQILRYELPHPTKILGLVDDPYSSYLRGVPYLWAFDGAFYVSPGYDEGHLFRDVLDDWGCRHHIWWPLGAHRVCADDSRDFYADRDMDIVYVGAAYGSKIDRLKVLKRHFGDRFKVFGRWPLRGYYGFARGLLGKPFFFHRVDAVSDRERDALYANCKIGFNMHMSSVNRDVGNMRMFEIPAHGMMQVCNKGGCGAHQQVFRDGEEAVFYEDIDDAIAKIEYYLAHDDERISIARAGHQRVARDYRREDQLKRALDWASELHQRRQRGEV